MKDGLNSVETKIKNYLKAELNEIGKPKNPNNKQVYKFTDVEVTIKLLFQLLAESSDLEEPTLQRVGNNFYNHSQKIVDIKVEELPNAIEGLATNYEPFLKLIAYLKYGRTELWEPNKEDSSAGISKTTLNNLIIGKVNNKYKIPSNVPLINIPEPLIEYRGMKRTILDFVRQELRNAVHNAKKYSRMELVHYSNIVLSCYLFTVEDNLLFLKKQFLKEFKYLKSVIDDKKYVSLNKVYVDLLGHENYQEIDIGATVLDDKFDLLSEIEDFTGYIDVDDADIIEHENRTDSIIKIAADTLHLEIIGQGGSGKTTTLYKILYNNAKEIYDGNKNLKIPFLIKANEYSPNNSFIKILSSKMNEEWAYKYLNNGHLQILIDGLNEITENYKSEAYREINSILRDYPENSVILTERKLGFEDKFEIPVYELKNLNDERILQFVESYAETNSEIIWKELQNNDRMLNLAYNPLMLKMILSVSKHGNIPKNRGLLYQLFIKTIFQREKTKKTQIRTATKIDVLSYVAFKMREKGTMTVAISKMKDYITKKLSKINSSVSVNLLYTQLKDNLFIYETNSDEVSFFHESYQEYFCAVQLKCYFEIADELPISLYDHKWFEALVMCGEIIKNEEKASYFFEYIFRGQKFTKEEKPLTSFGEEDFNVNINIACKIAYSLESVKPEIYELAERSLNNYIVFWKYLYYSRQTEAIPITNLFASVSSLNSSKLFEKIIKNLGWANIWLYAGIGELKNPFFIESVIPCYANVLQEHIAKEINNNLPEFTTFYDIINSSRSYYFFSKEIQQKLERLKYKVVQNSSENQLKLYYNENKDFSIFIQILKEDIDFVSNYDFTQDNEVKSKAVFRTIMRYHITGEKGQSVLISYLNQLINYSLINSFIEKLLFHCQYSALFEIFEILLKKDSIVLHENLPILQAISFNKLPDSLKGIFIGSGNDDIVKYSSLEKKSIGDYRCTILSESRYKISKNSFYKIEDGIIQFLDFFKYYYKGHVTIVLVTDAVVSEFPDHGVIEKSNFKMDYVSFRLTTKGDKFVLVTPISGSFNKDNWNIKGGDSVIINGRYGCEFVAWGVEQLENPKYLRARFELINPHDILDELPNKGAFNLAKNIIDTENSLSYHPELIENNEKLVKIIDCNIRKREYVNFVKEVGLTYLFHTKVPNVNYAIVLNIYKNTLKLYSITRKNIFETTLCSDDIKFFSVEKIVIVESNYRVNIIEEKEEILDRVGYKYSEIVTINEQRDEGFIKMVDEDNTSDYFFHFRSCNFNPKVGDYVKFIPALNPRKNYFNEPIALKVYKVDLPKCKVAFSVYDDQKERIWGKAVDIHSDEELFFRINYGQEKYITNFSGKIEQNDQFEYNVIKSKNNKLLPLIKLVKLIYS